MKRKHLLAVFILLILAAVMAIYFITINKQPKSSQSPLNKSASQELCTNNGGEWISIYKECAWKEASDKEIRENCQKVNGKFDECASRNWTDACYRVCTLK